MFEWAVGVFMQGLGWWLVASALLLLALWVEGKHA